MSISEQSQAVLLLTAWFSKPTKGDPKPLTTKEWGRFAQWLKDAKQSPDALLRSSDISQSLAGWSDRTIDETRIQKLLERAGALGIALEKWQRAGLWVMTRSDPDYPARLKKLLKFDAPPVLFGSGNRQLLDQGGIAVVGSRDTSPGDLAFSTHLGGQIALAGKTVVSGGARGVDEAAMLGALEKDGTAAGVLADSLLRASNSSKYRRALMDRNLVLVSPFNPEAGFDVGNAMARNKYIYCLATAAVVVSTSKDKGGTWSGATENLKQHWVRLWVKSNADTNSGNAALVDMGAHWLADDLQIDELAAGQEGSAAQVGSSLFDPRASHTMVREDAAVLSTEMEPTAAESLSPLAGEIPEAVANTEPAAQQAARSDSNPAITVPSTDLSLYEYFLRKLEAATIDRPLGADVLQERLEIGKTQLSDWLKRAIEEGRVEKSGKPVRYEMAKGRQQGLSL